MSVELRLVNSCFKSILEKSQNDNFENSLFNEMSHLENLCNSVNSEHEMNFNHYNDVLVNNLNMIQDKDSIDLALNQIKLILHHVFKKMVMNEHLKYTLENIYL